MIYRNPWFYCNLITIFEINVCECDKWWYLTRIWVKNNPRNLGYYAWFCSVTKQRQVWDWPGPWPSLTSRCCVYCILSVMFHSISSSVSGLLREKVHSTQIVARSWQFTITLDIGGMESREYGDSEQWQQVQILHEATAEFICLVNRPNSDNLIWFE